MHAPTARALVLALVTMLGAGSCSRSSSGDPPRRVIIITCDTLRADRLGVYGYPKGTSPNLDELARESVVFDEMYASASMTVPSLSSLMTGLLPDEVGVQTGNNALVPPAVTTLAEVLSQAGFDTGAVVSNWVLRRNEKAGGTAGLQQGFRHYDDHMSEKEIHRDFFDRVGPDTTAAAIEWLSQRGASSDDRMFLWVHYQDPHGPYTPPAELVKPSDAPHERIVLPFGTTPSGKQQLPSYQRIGDENDADFYLDRYDAEIRYFDRAVGDLLSWLKAHGMYEDSLIVFTADHGESLGEHNFWFCHGESLFRELVRVPFFVRAPKGSRVATSLATGAARDAGGFERREDLASHTDLVPTLLEALGLPEQRSRGTSLAHAIPADRIVVQMLAPMGHPHRWVGITDRDHRLLLHLPKARLYAYRTDPYELENLAEKDPARVAAMTDYYSKLMEDVRRSMPGEVVRRDPTEKQKKNMRALGYVGDDDAEEPAPAPDGHEHGEVDDGASGGD